MSVRSWFAAAAVVVASSVAIAEGTAVATPPSAPLTIQLSNLRSDRGSVGCTIYDGPRGFPTDPEAARARTWCSIRERAATCRFDGVARGTHAVACFHDENDNKKCDTGLLGIPVEGTVVSNHARGRFGPPKFDDARFTFAGVPSALALRMGY